MNQPRRPPRQSLILHKWATHLLLHALRSALDCRRSRFGRDPRVHSANCEDHCDCALRATFDLRRPHESNCYCVRSAPPTRFKGLRTRSQNTLRVGARIACKRVLLAPHFQIVGLVSRYHLPSSSPFRSPKRKERSSKCKRSRLTNWPMDSFIEMRIRPFFASRY